MQIFFVHENHNEPKHHSLDIESGSLKPVKKGNINQQKSFQKISKICTKSVIKVKCLQKF